MICRSLGCEPFTNKFKKGNPPTHLKLPLETEATQLIQCGLISKERKKEKKQLCQFQEIIFILTSAAKSASDFSECYATSIPKEIIVA